MSPYSLDHSLTHQNISTVTATVDVEELAGDILLLPQSIHFKTKRKTSTTADFRERIIEYYVKYSPHASWTELAGRLYYMECHEALAAAKKFIKRTPGKCVLRTVKDA